jgi:monoterpene epsilon-lactone hydrolase
MANMSAGSPTIQRGGAGGVHAPEWLLSESMPSWQARLCSLGIRALVRRRSWGQGAALARRARRVFGAPPGYRSLTAPGARRTGVRTPLVRGEWLTPDRPLPGTVLYIHGGGFVACSAATHRPIVAALARSSRRRVFSVDYRLAPEHPFPAAPADVLAAYEWLLETGAAPGSIALAGDSAGGNLALGLTQHLRDRNRPAPACLVLFSPWGDLTGSGLSVRANDGVDAMFRAENLGDFAAVYLAGAPTDTPAASPVLGDLSRLPPLLLHAGSTEILLDDARRIHQRALEAGGTSRLAVFDDVPHCWQMLVPLVPEARASLAAAGEFLNQHLPST